VARRREAAATGEWHRAAPRRDGRTARGEAAVKNAMVLWEEVECGGVGKKEKQRGLTQCTEGGASRRLESRGWHRVRAAQAL